MSDRQTGSTLKISINCKFLLHSASTATAATPAATAAVALITSLQFYGASKLMLNGFSRSRAFSTFRTRRRRGKVCCQLNLMLMLIFDANVDVDLPAGY